MCPGGYGSGGICSYGKGPKATCMEGASCHPNGYLNKSLTPIADILGQTINITIVTYRRKKTVQNKPHPTLYPVHINEVHVMYSPSATSVGPTRPTWPVWRGRRSS